MARPVAVVASGQEMASVRRVMVSARHETKPSQQHRVPKRHPALSQGILRSQSRIANHSHAKIRVPHRISGRNVNRVAISRMMTVHQSRDWAITCPDS
jgi:hypothetical protein